ncbi:MAG: alpha/beta hydrolase [Microthrixaceae bacterium]
MGSVRSADGVEIAFGRLDAAERSSRPRTRLLFAHATGFCSTVFRPMAAALSDTYECWALDFRAHGHSGRPQPGGLRWESIASDVAAVTDAVDEDEGIAPWAGVGHSMGGAALILAQTAGTTPRFDRLWVYEPVVFPPAVVDAAPDPGEMLALGALRRRSRFEDREEARRNYSAKPPMSAFHRASVDGYLERGLRDLPDGTVELSCRPADEAETYRMGGRHHAWDSLPSLSIPVTVVTGDTSRPGPGMFAERIAGRITLGTVEVHPELGHFGPMEDPESMARSVRMSNGSSPLPR